SARSAALRRQLDNTCAANVGLHLESRRNFRDVFRVDRMERVDATAGTADVARRQEFISAQVGSTAGVTAPVTTVFGATAIKSARHGSRDLGDLDRRKIWLAGRS